MTLRIQRSEQDEQVAFKLTGRIQAQDILGLLDLVRSELRHRVIVMDLEQVRLVDRDAVLFLALSEAVGARLKNCSAYIREWINQERNAMDRNGTEGPTGFGE